MNILYEDNHIIVVYKNYGVLSQADNTNKDDMLTLIKNYIKIKYNKPGDVYLGLVHRLDINTEGIMVFAKTSKAAKRLSDDIQKNRFNKEYIAICEGIISNDATLENYLIKDENIRKAFVDKKGKLAKLNYTIINTAKLNNKDVTYVKVKLITGRFHQIRCQFSNIGHPLFGDVKYGSLNKTNNSVLQAYKLEFYHPTLKELMTFSLIDRENNFKYLREGEI